MKDGLQVITNKVDSCEKIAKTARTAAAAAVASAQGIEAVKGNAETYLPSLLGANAAAAGSNPSKILRTCSSAAESNFYKPMAEGIAEPHSKHRERGCSRPGTPSAVELHAKHRERSSGASRPNTPGPEKLKERVASPAKIKERSTNATRPCTLGPLALPCSASQRGLEPPVVEGLSPLSSHDCTPTSATGRRSRRSSSGTSNTHGSCHKLHRVMHAAQFSDA